MEIDTYLLTWNPRRWRWEELEEEARQTLEGGPVVHHWSCGNTKSILSGDRVFLFRAGKDPRGVLAAGWAASDSYEAPHWDETRAEQGETSNLVKVRLDRILNPEVDEILALDQLQVGSLASINWTSQSASGMRIRHGVEDLERLWGNLLKLYQPLSPWDEEPSAIEGESRIALVRHRARERNLRERKIAHAKAGSGGRLPCEVCGFDFLQSYGELGRDYAQVHHLKPLADLTKPSLTRLADLAVVCANCHAMIHRGGGARPLEEVRQVLHGPNSTSG